MNYLLVNYVFLGKGSSPNRIILGDMWLEDLRATVKAWKPYGRLCLAAPLSDNLSLSESGSFNLIEIDPAEEGFDFVPLPTYSSLKTLIKTLPEIRHRLHRAAQSASIIQADYNGHPISLGQIVWSIAKKQNKKYIWVFDGADPIPRMERFAAQEPNPLIRMIKKKMVERFNGFCKKAIREADLVFTHNASVIERFQDVWGDHCYIFDRSFVTEQILICDEQAASRQKRIMDTSLPLRLVAAGRQTDIKATDHVLKAMAIALRRGADLEFDVLGDGDALENYKQLSRELGIAERVRFVGSVPYGQPLFDALEPAQVLVVTNLTAEISRNVFLGMARGLPLLLYRNPGTDALIESHNAGILVPNGDINALSTALFEAHLNRNRLADLVTNGLMLAQTKTLERTHRRRAELAAASIQDLGLHPPSGEQLLQLNS